tara:strand:+ start:438 stop:665 length:228 start_codon:yes stop_codon:yes gene_type:complete
MNLKQTIFADRSKSNIGELQQGDCVKLIDDKNLFQVIGIDTDHQKCWVRKWPLMEKGSPVFEISLHQIYITVKNR